MKKTETFIVLRDKETGKYIEGLLKGLLSGDEED